MIWLEERSPSHAVETPTIIEEDNEGVSERVPSFGIEFADILLRAAKPRNRWTASHLFELVTDTSFNLNIL